MGIFKTGKIPVSHIIPQSLKTTVSGQIQDRAKLCRKAKITRSKNNPIYSAANSALTCGKFVTRKLLDQPNIRLCVDCYRIKYNVFKAEFIKRQIYMCM